MPTEVLFTPFESRDGETSLNRRLAGIIRTTEFFRGLSEGSKVAIKVHPGERNNSAYLRPSIVSSLAGLITDTGASPFVTETTTLYCRERFTPEELLATAAFNGYSRESIGCPFTVADSVPDVIRKVEGEYLKEVGVAGEIAGADALLVLTHVTCHGWMAGLAASVKQLGMGCVGRKTKADVHLATNMAIDAELCTACGTCAEVCKSEAVAVNDDHAVLTEQCVRCGVCIGFCPESAIGYSHDYDRFSKATAEAAAGVMSLFDNGNALFVNCILDVTEHCNCEDFSSLPAFPDIGVVISSDPIAADMASGNLLNSSVPVRGSCADKEKVIKADDKILALTGIEWWRQLDHGEAMGLGTTDYQMTRF